MGYNKELLEVIRTFVFKACNAKIIQKIDPYGLTFIQRSMLVYLENGPKNITDMGKILCVTKPAMTKVVDTMVQKGFIKRTNIEDDRRSYYLVLTDKGSKILKKINIVPLKAIDRVMKGISEVEKRNYLKTFSLFVKRLNDIGG